jgi:alkanesulfonate monooxygenase
MTINGQKTTNIDRFGVFLPSFVWPGDGPDRARGIMDFAREVENIGFDSIFITDHLLAAAQFYSVSFLEPLTTLALVAGVTERVKLGTSVLVMPIREPVLLAKQLATMQFLSNNRIVLGAGIGWYPPEYANTGVKKSERGARTDEILEIIVPLLEGETVTYQGQFYSIEDVLIEPRSSRRPEVWIGGGSQLADPGSPDLPRIVEPVKRRILAAEGWVPRPTCPPEDIARDWNELQSYFNEHGRDPAELTVVHENFYHFVGTEDGGRARREQHEAMLKVMSEARGPEYLERVYLFGTPDEVVESLQARVEAGVQSFILHTMTPDPAQLEQWATHIIPHVRFPVEDR